jgi:hypothetical protein
MYGSLRGISAEKLFSISSTIELKPATLFALGFIFLFCASLGCDYGLKVSQKACSKILWCLEYGSSLRRSSGNTNKTVGLE